MMKHFLVLSTLAAALSASGCMPDHLEKFDGRTALAAFDGDRTGSFALRDDSGNSFYVKSSSVLVKFEVNRIRASRIYLTDEGRTATFFVPKSALNQGAKVVALPSRVSKQPVDLLLSESSKVLKSWQAFRHVSTPIFMSVITPGPNGTITITQTVVGYNDDYYEDAMGLVERSVQIGVYSAGALSTPEPERLKQNQLKMEINADAEILGTKAITSAEYAARGARQ